jgi:hypothetical protein
MHDWMHVSGTYSWRNGGVRGGVLVFEGGSALPRGGGKIRPSTPLRTRAQFKHLVRQNDLRVVPPAVDHPQFAVFRRRNREIRAVRLEKRGNSSRGRRDRSDRRGVCIIIRSKTAL